MAATTSKMLATALMLLASTASAFFCPKCVDIVLIVDKGLKLPVKQEMYDELLDIIKAAKETSEDMRMGMISVGEEVSVECGMTSDMDTFAEDVLASPTLTEEVELAETASSEAVSFAIGSQVNSMCFPKPPITVFGDLRPPCIKIVVVINTKKVGACGGADDFCDPEETAMEAAEEDISVSVIADEEEEEMPYPMMTGGMYKKMGKKNLLPLLIAILKKCGKDPKPTMMPVAAPVPAPTPDPDLGGDPHVYTTDGRIVDIYLQPGLWTHLMAGKNFAISGRVFSRTPQDASTQWFDGFRVERVSTGEVVFEAIRPNPHDVNIGKVRPHGDEVQYLDVTLGDNKCTMINTTYTEGSLAVTPTKLQTAARIEGPTHPIFNDHIEVNTPDFSFALSVSAALDPANFDSYAEMLKETHIDFKFKQVDDIASLSGPVAELMYPGVHNKSAVAETMTHVENAFAHIA